MTITFMLLFNIFKFMVKVYIVYYNTTYHLMYMHVHACIYRTLAKEGPWAAYIGSRLEDGPIFEVSVSQLYAKERPGKLPTLAS